MSDNTALLARMEADHAKALREIDDLTQWLGELRQRAGELEISIRTVRSYVSPEETAAAPRARPAIIAEVVPIALNGSGKSPWDGHSIRSAAIEILRRTPGEVVSAQQIAEALIAEHFPFKDDKRPIKVQRVRETVSAVLNQHIERKAQPHIEKPEPARFIFAQQDAFADLDSLLDTEADGQEKGDPA